jgi:hypothetical protein
MTIEEEIASKVRQTIRTTKSTLTAFFNAKEFTIINLLPQGIFCRQRDFSIGQPARSAAGGHRSSQTSFSFRRFQVPPCSACPRKDD